MNNIRIRQFEELKEFEKNKGLVLTEDVLLKYGFGNIEIEYLIDNNHMLKPDFKDKKNNKLILRINELEKELLDVKSAIRSRITKEFREIDGGWEISYCKLGSRSRKFIVPEKNVSIMRKVLDKLSKKYKIIEYNVLVPLILKEHCMDESVNKDNLNSGSLYITKQKIYLHPIHVLKHLGFVKSYNKAGQIYI